MQGAEEPQASAQLRCACPHHFHSSPAATAATPAPWCLLPAGGRQHSECSSGKGQLQPAGATKHSVWHTYQQQLTHHRLLLIPLFYGLLWPSFLCMQCLPVAHLGRAPASKHFDTSVGSAQSSYHGHMPSPTSELPKSAACCVGVWADGPARLHARPQAGAVCDPVGVGLPKQRTWPEAKSTYADPLHLLCLYAQVLHACCLGARSGACLALVLSAVMPGSGVCTPKWWWIATCEVLLLEACWCVFPCL